MRFAALTLAFLIVVPVPARGDAAQLDPVRAAILASILERLGPHAEVQVELLGANVAPVASASARGDSQRELRRDLADLSAEASAKAEAAAGREGGEAR